MSEFEKLNAELKLQTQLLEKMLSLLENSEKERKKSEFWLIVRSWFPVLVVVVFGVLIYFWVMGVLNGIGENVRMLNVHFAEVKSVIGQQYDFLKQSLRGIFGFLSGGVKDVFSGFGF